MSSSTSDNENATGATPWRSLFLFVPRLLKDSRIMTFVSTESTDALRQRTNDYLRSRLAHLTTIVSALDALDTAWCLAQERDSDERAALESARRRLASLLDCEVSE